MQNKPLHTIIHEQAQVMNTECILDRLGLHNEFVTMALDCCIDTWQPQAPCLAILEYLLTWVRVLNADMSTRFQGPIVVLT